MILMRSDHRIVAVATFIMIDHQRNVTARSKCLVEQYSRMKLRGLFAPDPTTSRSFHIIDGIGVVCGILEVLRHRVLFESIVGGTQA